MGVRLSYWSILRHSRPNNPCQDEQRLNLFDPNMINTTKHIWPITVTTDRYRGGFCEVWHPTSEPSSILWQELTPVTTNLSPVIPIWCAGRWPVPSVLCPGRDKANSSLIYSIRAQNLSPPDLMNSPRARALKLIGYRSHTSTISLKQRRRCVIKRPQSIY